MIPVVSKRTIAVGPKAISPPGCCASALGQTGAVLRLALHDIIKGHPVIPYISNTVREIDRFFKADHAVIILLTDREILDEQIARKLAWEGEETNLSFHPHGFRSR